MAGGTAGGWRRRIGRVLVWAAVVLITWIGLAAIIYSPEYVGRVLRSRESSVEDYLFTFPLRTMTAADEPFMFGASTDAEPRVRALLEVALGTIDLDAFLDETDTQALIVIQDGTVLLERYASGTSRDSLLTSFSVAKSFDSALVGIAIDEGFIGSVDDPITDYLPELGNRDFAFGAITIRHLLLMAAGLDYQEFRWFLFNGDDPLTTYYPDQRRLALENTNIVDPPGLYFNYNKYHPQLLGMILERTTGMSVTEYTQTRLWDRLGMEYDGAWALDDENGFEKMEAGVNARAIDYAKLGQLYLQEGIWEGEQIISADWIEASTSLDPATHNAEYYAQSFGPAVYAEGRGYYKYMWYGRLRDGRPADIFAEGDHGQFIYVSPAHGVVIVRNGFEWGIASNDWIDAFYEVAGRLSPEG
jgi:CubicO group peptidase (beta-lactamase class C family)